MPRGQGDGLAAGQVEALVALAGAKLGLGQAISATDVGDGA
jgi:hypothetical protein